MENTTDIPVIGKLMELTGIQDVWFFACIILFILCVIFIAAAISSSASKRRLKKEIVELNEYITGLEAMTKLPPMKAGEGDSIVFASSREMRAMEEQERSATAAEATAPIPKISPEDIPSPKGADNVTAAVHDAILASVTGSMRPVAAPEEQGKPAEPVDPATLNDKIPRI